MSIFPVLKQILKSLRLQNASLSVVRAYARVFQRQLSKRNGIRYDLDLTEVIDFAIFVGGWESETLKFLDDNVKPADVVIEVGANIGAHTLAIAKLVGPHGQCYAFEPTEYAATKLQRNIDLNPQLRRNIRVVRELVTNGAMELPTLRIRSSWKLEHETNATAETVPPSATSIDQFVDAQNIERVDLIKIDVDGYDFKVLQGSVAVLKKFKPLLFIELCEYALNKQGDSIRDILGFLDDLGYSGRFESGAPIPDADAVMNITGQNSSINGIFTPMRPVAGT
jgi:FkbM family methyltransferase